MKTVKIGRNDSCPCESGRKHKKCCQGKVPWEQILAEPRSHFPRHLSARGKNIRFLEVIGEALQLDKLELGSWSEVKRACTVEAVTIIHEAVMYLWPDKNDLVQVFEKEKGNTSALYTGNYEPEDIIQGVTRHSLYSKSILLFDPFEDPRAVRPEFSPIEKPSLHRVNTIRFVRLWLALAPWISNGVIRFIRSPGDFDIELRLRSMQRMKEYSQDPEFSRLLDDLVAEGMEHSSIQFLKEYYSLLQSDDYLAHELRLQHPDIKEKDVEAALEHIAKRREEHPFFVPLDPDTGEGSMIKTTRGENYEIARLTTNLTSSHLISDNPFSWAVMERERKKTGVEQDVWEPFAVAFQKLEFKFLNNIPLEIALEQRQKRRLEALRTFLLRVWRASSTEQPFDEKNVYYLSKELEHHVREAEQEWEKIDKDLREHFVDYLPTLLATGGPAIATGEAKWVAAAAIATAAKQLGSAWYKRKSFEKRFPAGLFLKLKGKAD